MSEFNIFKKKLLGIFGKRESFLFDKEIMHPSRDWFLVVFAGIIFLCTGGFWSVSVYIQFSNVSVTDIGEVTEGGGYQQGLVNAALLELDQRIEKYNNLKSTILSNRNYAPVIEISDESVDEMVETEVEVSPAEESVASSTVPARESEIEFVPIQESF